MLNTYSQNELYESGEFFFFIAILVTIWFISFLITSNRENKRFNRKLKKHPIE